MAVVIHSHTLGAVGAPEAADRAALRLALRVSSDQVADDAADELILAASDVLEGYTGRLVGSRSSTVVLEVAGGPELVDPCGHWRPAPTLTELAAWDADAAAWGSDVLGDHRAADPLGRRKLAAGWWRVTGDQGDGDVGSDWTEALHRLAAHLFDSDPSRVARRPASLVRACGAAELLGPYCERGARPVEV